MENKNNFTPTENYQKSKNEIGYVDIKNATEEDYKRIGFKSGLEVHQQLKTKEKLFCHCPAGIYHSNDEYDAEIIRHMRPTLSELGEYDGTALMEYKTRKEIIYRINNETACTYDIDDTPPFKMDEEALDIALEISLLSKLNIVGEVHITRKQYLDGSIPTGFQRTAIIGVEGEIPLKHKKVRLIQLSLEEDSCREISDIRHTRFFKTDRLGMPLIETVTYPDMLTPYELKEAAEYIRFLNRSTDKVRTGIGSGREDVNVSCQGGTRVELKGVAHNKLIPKLSHNESFRQWALLNVREKLNKKISKTYWKVTTKEIQPHKYKLDYQPLLKAYQNKEKIFAANLPGFKGILSHFTQPGKIFADEIEDRLKVIACLERPNMTHSEELNPNLNEQEWSAIKKEINAESGDAQIIFWAPQEDVKTAIETIEERCQMAFDGVPRETRKTFHDGTTVFERVLPGPDRMYPDTDSAPIPLNKNYIEGKRKNLPEEIIHQYEQLMKWNIPEDTHKYIFRNNLFPLIKKISENLDFKPKFIGTFLGHRLKFVEGHYEKDKNFDYNMIYELFNFIRKKKLEPEIARKMLPYIYQNPTINKEELLSVIGYKKNDIENLKKKIPTLNKEFDDIKISVNNSSDSRVNWIMGKLSPEAIGNISFKKLREITEDTIENNAQNS
ncbi:MAG: Glu-tRNA(Gln) amidotransferase subunit GatE [Bacteroidales bacterium]